MIKKVLSSTFLILSDTLVIISCFALSYYIRDAVLPLIIPQFRSIKLPPFIFFLKHFYMISIWIFVFFYEKLYTKRYPFWDEVKFLLKSSSISSFLIISIIFITRTQILFSRTIVILAWLISLLLFPISRYFIKRFLSKINIWKKNIIILGANKTGLLALKGIQRNKTLGYKVLGFLDNNSQKIGNLFHGIKVLGNISEFEEITKKLNSKVVIIALPSLPNKKLYNLLEKYEDLTESISIIPPTGSFITSGVDIEILGQLLTLNIKRNLSKPWNLITKTFFDKLASLILLIALFPFFIIIAILIKFDSKGPIFFLQKRIGKNIKSFKLIKFRSMYTNCNSILSRYLRNNPKAHEEWKKYKKLKKYDPRVTRVGRLLRKLSIDEFPQLFNVLLGKMNLVGPRPYLSEELKGKYSFKKSISKVKPGVTGLWQVSGRSDLDFEERINLDEYYIRNWSLWLDFIILIRSFKVFFSGKGAY